MITGKLYPDDYYSDTKSTLGINLPMNSVNTASDNNIFNMSVLTEEQVVGNFINVLLTRKGERIMHPNFGVGLMDYVFDQLNVDNLGLLENEIYTQMSMWLPYVQIHELRLSPDVESKTVENSLGIYIVFSANENGANITLTIFNVNGKPYISINKI